LADVTEPSTAYDLRRACARWPLPVVRRAVAAVVPEPDAALIAAWLTNTNAPADPPPLLPGAIAEIARQLQAQRQ
jgi:hypothetical protein